LNVVMMIMILACSSQGKQ